MAESHSLEINVKLNLEGAGQQAEQFRQQQQSNPVNIPVGGGSGNFVAAQAQREASAVNSARAAVDARNTRAFSAADQAIRDSAARTAIATGATTEGGSSSANAFIASTVRQFPFLSQSRVAGTPFGQASVADQIAAAAAINPQGYRQYQRGSRGGDGGTTMPSNAGYSNELNAQAMGAAPPSSPNQTAWDRLPLPEPIRPQAQAGNPFAVRMAARFAIGYAAREVFRLTGAAYDRESAIALSGGDLREQSAAWTKWNQAASVFGEPGAAAADVLQTAFYRRDVSRLGTSLVTRQAELTDDQTQMLRRSGELQRGFERTAALDAAQTDRDRQRIGVRYQAEDQRRESQDLRTQQSTSAANFANLRRSELENSLGSRARNLARQYQQQNPGMDFNGALLAAREELTERDEANVESDRRARLQRINEGYRNRAAPIDAAERLKFQDIDRQDQATRIEREANIRSNNLAASDRGYESRIFLLREHTRAEVARRTDPTDRTLAFLGGVSEINRFESEFRRQRDDHLEQLGYDTRARFFEVSGDSLAASKNRIIAEREQRQRGVGVGTPGEGQLRQQIDLNALAQFAQAVKNFQLQGQALGDRAAVTAFAAQGKPVQGQVEEIARAAAIASQSLSGQQRKDVLQIGINQEEALKRSLLFGGQAGEVSSGSFGAGGGQGGPAGEQIPTLLQAIKDAIDNMKDAIANTP